MSTGLLTAGNGQSWETDLVAALDRPGAGMTVVRRCVDIADVLAAATTGEAQVAVLSADLRRLDSEAVQRLVAAGVGIVGIHPAADLRARTRLERIGVEVLVADDTGPAALLQAVRLAMTTDVAGASAAAAHRVVADVRSSLPPTTPVSEPGPLESAGIGRVIAVWGPAGAPGRSTVAAGLAVEMAATGASTLLVDADVYGGVLGSAFGLLDESPGLAGACRLAANGKLDLIELTRLAWSVGPDLRLLTGITRADRWPEVRPSAIPAVLAVTRSMATMVLVDCGFCLEADEEITFDTVAPRRNGATLAVLAAADQVVAVGSADPAGMERLIRGLAELAEAIPGIRPTVVLNRLRKTAASADETAAALNRFTGLPVAGTLPEDRAATDLAWRLGISLAEAAPSSPLRAALRAFAGMLLPSLARA